MAGKSSQSDNRGSSLFSSNVSGKEREYHTYESAKTVLPVGIEATGGLTTSITDGGKNYKVHTFLATGVFDVTSIGALSSEIEYLVVAGGASGGQNLSGGGGAGGLRTNLSGHPLAADPYTVGIGTYQVTIGAGGASVSSAGAKGNPGNDSEFYPPAASYPNAAFIRAVKGGGGAGGPGGATHVQPGGSGGGAPGYAYAPGLGGDGNVADPNHPKIQGYPGGNNVGNPTTAGYGLNYIGGGGGGAGGAGIRGDAPNEGGDGALTGNGGAGVQVNIDGNNYYYAGGGGAGAYTNTDSGRHAGDGGIGGGGGGASNATDTKGIGGGSARNSGGDGTPAPTSTTGQGGAGGENTGGGGGGCGHDSSPNSGAGGKGIVIIRYQVP